MGTKQNQQKRKSYGGKDWRKPGATFKSLLPVESHRMHLTHLVTSCDNTCETVFIREALLSPGVQGFYWGVSHVGTLCPAYTKTLDIQKEGRCSVQTVLFAQRVLAQGATLVGSGNGEMPPDIQVPRSQPRTTLANSLKSSVLTPSCMGPPPAFSIAACGR